MDISSFYLPTCNQGDVEAFSGWLLSHGFAFARDESYFRGVVKVYSRGIFGIKIAAEYGAFSFSMGRVAGGPWFAVDDVMELLGKGVATKSDPAKSLGFMKENIDDIQKLLESPNFDNIAKELDQNRIRRYDRLWPKSRPRA